MDRDIGREIAERDQLWASLRALRPVIDLLAAGQLPPSDDATRVAQLLARVVAAEMDFRARDAGE